MSNTLAIKIPKTITWNQALISTFYLEAAMFKTQSEEISNLFEEESL